MPYLRYLEKFLNCGNTLSIVERHNLLICVALLAILGCTSNLSSSQSHLSDTPPTSNTLLDLNQKIHYDIDNPGSIVNVSIIDSQDGEHGRVVRINYKPRKDTPGTGGYIHFSLTQYDFSQVNTIIIPLFANNNNFTFQFVTYIGNERYQTPFFNLKISAGVSINPSSIN